ncbi:MAG: hypothetical protein N3Z28_12355, partial [Synechococcaceae cyanobacterium MAG-AL2]|uniref:hypothetical protein n=1 Tax=Candidatus Regnicoccus frigidus TaxID=3074015 RepID=UPI00281E8432
MNQLVGLLQSHAPRAISTGNLLHPSARLLSEIRSTALLPGARPPPSARCCAMAPSVSCWWMASV